MATANRICQGGPSRTADREVRTMSWTWRYEDPTGSTVVPLDTAPTAEAFPNQADAESWVGEHWRELLDAGVAQVTLFEDDRKVYGPMGLDAA